MGVHFSSPVTLLDVDEGLVEETDGLNIVGGLDPLEPSESTLRNETSTVTRLGAPCNHLALNVADDATRVLGAPNAPV